MSRRPASQPVAVLLLLILIAIVGRYVHHRAPPIPVAAPDAQVQRPPPADVPARATPDPVRHPEIGFRSRAALDEHVQKHGREFGPNITAADYLRRAQALRDAPAGGPILELQRAADGVTCRFDRRSGDFLAFNPDRTIRTFFRPNDGEAYFKRQAQRAQD
ncbi:MAG TPA: hypothetical protein VH475_29405 [Tepidisphaeraceae bacterium]|jgi:hypothetical protein